MSTKRISLTQYLIEQQRGEAQIPAQLRLLIEVVARACKRIAINVAPIFASDGEKWLGQGTTKDVWAVAFHGTQQGCAKGIVRAGLQAGGSSGVPVVHGARFGSGIYTTPFPSYALGYATPFAVPGYAGKWLLLFQARVRPGSYAQRAQTKTFRGATEACEWVVNRPEDLRLYGLCLFPYETAPRCA